MMTITDTRQHAGNSKETPLTILKTGLGKCDKKLLKGHAFFHIPESLITYQTIRLPVLTAKDLEMAMRHQVSGHEKLLWRNQWLQEEVGETKTQNRYIITKIDPETIKPYITLFEEFDLNVTAIVSDAEVIEGLVQSKILEIPLEKHTAFVTNEDQSFNVTVVHQHKLIFNRQFKNTLGKTCHALPPSTAELTPELQTLVDDAMTEIKASLSFFDTRTPPISIDAIYPLDDCLAMKPIFESLEKSQNPPCKKPALKPNTTLAVPMNDAVSGYLKAIGAATNILPKTAHPLLPDPYRFKWLHKVSLACFAIGIPLILALNFAMGSWYAKEIKVRNKKISQKRNSFTKLEKKLATFKKGLTSDSKKLESIETIFNTLIYKVPIDDFLYQLSLWDFRELYIDKIEIRQSSLKISGKVLTSATTTAFTKHLNNIKSLSYINNLDYRIKKQNKIISTFTITARMEKEKLRAPQ